MIGMNCIILAWAGSMEGVGVSRIWKTMVAPISRGMILIGRPKTWPIVSLAARSVAQRKGEKRSSAVLWSMVKKPMKNGIVMRMGRQPPTGLTLFVLNSAMVASCCLRGLSLYFSRTTWSSGWSFAIRLADLEAASVKGTKMILSVSVVRMIAMPQLLERPWIHVISVRRIWLKYLKKPKSMTLSWSALKIPAWASRAYSFGPT